MKLINIYIVASVPVVIEGFKIFLRDNPYFVLAGNTNRFNTAFSFLKNKFSGIILIDDSCYSISELKQFITSVSELKRKKIVLFTGKDNANYLRDIVKLPIKGVIQKRSGKKKILEALKLVSEGGIYYDNLLTYAILQQNIKNSIQTDGIIPFLSKREKELLTLVAEGFKNTEIAKQLFICKKTVENHKTRILKKLKVKTTAELAILVAAHKEEFNH